MKLWSVTNPKSVSDPIIAMIRCSDRVLMLVPFSIYIDWRTPRAIFSSNISIERQQTIFKRYSAFVSITIACESFSMWLDQTTA